MLIVEDAAVMRALLGRAIATLGDVTWDEAVDGVDALRKLRRVNYDCIFVDVNMPRIDGLKLIERIRSHETAHAPRIVVVTTQSGERDRERALALGADAYVVKPIKLPEITALLRRLLARDR